MTRPFKSLAVLGFLVLVCFGWGLWELFAIRFSAGDVFPPYSSLRADPLGTRALHDSLASLRGLRVDRLHRPLAKLEETGNTTVFWLGAAHDVQPDDEWREFVRAGGRLVVGWAPSQFVERSATNAAGPFPWQQARYRKGPLLPPEARSQEPEDVAFRAAWGVDLSFIELPLPTGEGEARVEPAVRVAELPLPGALAWHSTVCFTNLHEDWRVIYERRGAPVMIERRFGIGTVVISTDSWPASNEALRHDRHPDLLRWWIGGNQRVLFDELHLGVEVSPGMATMLRRYRMHGLAGALAVLALLFLWRSASSFLPRQEVPARQEAGHAIEGRDAASGFVNLLRRAIRANDLLKTCFAEWKQGVAGGNAVSKERLQRMEQVMMAHDDPADAAGRDPVTTYRRLHQAWKEAVK